MQGETLKLSTF